MFEKIFKNENALLKKTNEFLRKDIESYKKTIERKNEEIEHLRYKLEKECLSEQELVELLISQYDWQFDYELFKGEYMYDCFKIIIEKPQKISKGNLSRLILNIEEK